MITRQESTWPEGCLPRRPPLMERILRGDELSVSVLDGPPLLQLIGSAQVGQSLTVPFIISGAGALAIQLFLQYEQELLKRRVPFNGITCPELYEDTVSLKVAFSFKTISEEALADIPAGILPRGIATFALKMESFLFFEYAFPMIFCGPYSDRALGIRGNALIPAHAPWSAT